MLTVTFATWNLSNKSGDSARALTRNSKNPAENVNLQRVWEPFSKEASWICCRERLRV